MYVSYLATFDFDIYSNKLNRYDLKRCKGFRLKICYLQKPEMTNEVLLSMLRSNSEEYETFINNEFLENTYWKKYHIKHIFESNDIVAKTKYHKIFVTSSFAISSPENLLLSCHRPRSYM